MIRTRKAEHVLSAFDLGSFIILGIIALLLLGASVSAKTNTHEDQLTSLRAAYLGQQALNSLLYSQTESGPFKDLVIAYFVAVQEGSTVLEDIQQRQNTQTLIREHTQEFISVLNAEQGAAVEGISFELHRYNKVQEDFVVASEGISIRKILQVTRVLEEYPRQVEVFLPFPEDATYSIRVVMVP